MPTPLPPHDTSCLRQHLVQAHFTEERLRALLVGNEFPSRQLRNLPRLTDRVASPTAFHLLVRWFILGLEVPRSQAGDLFPSQLIDLLLRARLLAVQGDSLAPTAALLPYGDLLIASDPFLRIEDHDSPEIVIGLNATTWLLHRFAIRRPARSMLDLGCGCGFHALVAARHSHQVVATDINPRAVEFARFNASLNGLTNIECVTGNLFEPVVDRIFDLILSNPPFFILPTRHLIYCGNPMELDHFCRLIVKQAPRYLSEGGFLQMMCEWVEVRGQAWRERLSEWFEGTGCDAWAIKNYTVEPDRYGEQRIRETTAYGPDTDTARYREWKAYYESRDVVAVHGGILALRRRTGRNWFRFNEISALPEYPFGDAIGQGFELRDLLESLVGDEALLELKPRLSLAARLHQRFHPGQKGWESQSLELTLARGLPSTVQVQPQVAEFVGRFDGTRTLRELVGELASQVPTDAAQVRQECLAVTRVLMERGFVLAEAPNRP
jgi:SAM-dependent methyltransferase